MKKSLLIAIAFIMACKGVSAQTVQGTLLPGSASNRVIVAIKADGAFSASFSNVQFVIRIPRIGVSTPTVSILNNFIPGFIPAYNFSTVSSATPIAFNDDGAYWNYLFSSAPAGQPAFNFTTSTTNVLELQINGGQGIAQVQFANLPNGGASGQHYFYIEAAGVDRTNETQMFYGAGFNNTGSYGSLSFVPLSNVTLPVIFSSYDVKCNDKGALITWSTSWEQNSKNFEVQSSSNGVDWTVVGTVPAAGNSSDIHNYQFIDLNSSSQTQYRIRQVDMDNRYTYTSVRLTNCSTPKFDVVLYPVPAHDKLNVVVKSEMNLATQLSVIDMSGKVVNMMNVQLNKGTTNIIVPTLKLPAGQYVIVCSDPAVKISSKFTVAH